MRQTWVTLVIASSGLCVGFASQPPRQSATAKLFSSHVYLWSPAGVVQRISPGPATSPTSAMPASGPFVQPHIAPDGRAVAFYGGVSGRPRLWLYETATGSSRPITPQSVDASQPSFNATGTHIVYAADAVGNAPSTASSGRAATTNLFVTELNGATPRQITSGEFRDARPAFSPDGKNVVFVSNRDGAGRGLYVVSTDGAGKPRRIIEDNGIARPWYSPDGKFIYFTFFGIAIAEEHIRVWRVPAEGGSKEAVSPDGLPNSQGAFADLDGIHLWFHSAPRGAFRFDLRSRELTPITAPGFRAIFHVSRSRAGMIAFDSEEVDPAGKFRQSGKW
jgi:Tol biopolymer transport system component